jgi:hypothetical protein
MSELAHTTHVGPALHPRRMRLVAGLIVLALVIGATIVAWPDGDQGSRPATSPSASQAQQPQAGPASGTPSAVRNAFTPSDAGPASGTPSAVSGAFRSPDSGPAPGTPDAVSRSFANDR